MENNNQQRKSRLDEMFERANGINEEIPMELSKKISIYSEILWVIAIYIARANNHYGKAVSDRKQEYALALTQETGTAKDKEGKAELRISKFRKREFQAESELIRWKHSFLAMQEMINAKKKELEVLLIEWGGKGHGHGG